MEKKLYEWLPHIEDSVPKEAYGYPISMYSIALEGWRRGLSLKFKNNNRSSSVINYSLSDGESTYNFMGSRGSLVTNEANKICSDKYLTKRYLSQAGVSIPKGNFFDETVSDADILNSAKKLGFPLVIKPITGAGGRGVIANIKSEEDFSTALDYVKNDLNYKKIIIENHIEGKDYRVFVIGDKVIGAINRIPANVVGNGVSSIQELLDKKNQEKRKNPALKSSPIRKDKEMMSLLNNIGYTMDSVPANGERVFLKTKSNISAGGEPIDATDIITDEVKNNAIKAIQAIPGLVQGGVDILWDSATNHLAVLEVNTLPSIRTHLFPIEGTARDVPKAIIDYYFPKTKANHNSPLYYFDIAGVFKGFKDRTLQVVSIPDHPQGKLESYRYIFKNIDKTLVTKRKVHKIAKALELHGFIQSKGKSVLEIIISGQSDKVNTFKKTLSSELKLTDFVEYKWERPVKIGFEIIDSKPVKKKRKDSIKQSEYKRIEKERDFYRRKYHEIQNSKVWKYANVLRKLKRD